MSKFLLLRSLIIGLSFVLFGSSLFAERLANSHPVLHVYAARDGNAGEADCVPWQKVCLVYLNKGQPLVFSNYTYSVPQSGTPAISLSLSPTDATALNALVQKHHSQKLAFVVQGAIVWAPTLKVESVGPVASLTFESIQSRDDVVNVLSGKMP